MSAQATCGCHSCPGTQAGNSMLCLPTQATRGIFAFLTAGGLVDASAADRYAAEATTFTLAGGMAMFGFITANPVFLYYAGSTVLSGVTSFGAKWYFSNVDSLTIDLTMLAISGPTAWFTKSHTIASAAHKTWLTMESFHIFLQTTAVSSGSKVIASCTSSAWTSLKDWWGQPTFVPTTTPLTQNHFPGPMPEEALANG